MQNLGRRPIQIAIGGIVLLSLVGFLIGRAGLATAQDKPGSQSPDDAKTEKAPLKLADIPPETFVVPDKASVPDLLRFIAKIDGLRPEIDSEAEVVKFLTKSRGAILTAADKILATKPTESRSSRRLKPSCRPTRS